MTTFTEVRAIIGSVLQLGERTSQIDESTLLLGSIPEFDSMAVVSLIAALEEHFGLVVEDDEISAATFETAGSVYEFVLQKLNA